MRHGLVLAVLVGCDGSGKDLENGPHCEDTPTVVALDEVTELGVAAQALVDLAQGTHEETFTWARDDSTTPLALTVTWDGGEARFVDSEPVYPEGESPAIGIVCDDRVEVDVDVTFATDDGAFDEAWGLALEGLSADLATFHQELDPDDLGGTYDMDVDITEPYEERGLWSSGSFDAAGARGEVMGQISGSGDCEDGDTCTAWAGEVPIGTWGVQER